MDLKMIPMILATSMADDRDEIITYDRTLSDLIMKCGLQPIPT